MHHILLASYTKGLNDNRIKVTNVAVLNTNAKFVNVSSQGEEFCTIKVSFVVKAQKLCLELEPDLSANGTISKQTYHMSDITMGALLNEDATTLYVHLDKLCFTQKIRPYTIYLPFTDETGFYSFYCKWPGSKAKS